MKTKSISTVGKSITIKVTDNAKGWLELIEKDYKTRVPGAPVTAANVVLHGLYLGSLDLTAPFPTNAPESQPNE